MKIGQLIELPEHLIFFGNRHGTEQALRERFPDFDFRFLKQVHGDDIVEALGARQLCSAKMHRHPEGAAADGHFTAEKNVALCIYTADCAPIMLIGEKRICAVHAGWRGVEANIVSKVSRHLRVKTAYVGPHIMKQSFEVGDDVAQRLLVTAKTVGAENPNDLFKDRHFDLQPVINAQLAGLGLDQVQIHQDSLDTMTSAEHFSYRREGPKAGRNISFVVKL